MTTPSGPWLPIPSPIRRLFTSFPLQTFSPAPLPSSCPQPTNSPRLVIYSNSPTDLPSWDAQSLKWQVFAPSSTSPFWLIRRPRHFCVSVGRNVMLCRDQSTQVHQVNYLSSSFRRQKLSPSTNSIISSSHNLKSLPIQGQRSS